MPRDARVAAYYVPPPDDPLFAAGAGWLGRDPDANVRLRQPELPGIEEVAAAPRLYGFHATLKPPMRLAPGRGWFELLQAARMLAVGIAPFDLPPLEVADIDGFLALRETAPCPALQNLADACVEHLDAFRAPPDGEELARRRAAGLTPEQNAMLARWGYPYVFDTWFFHMTLTRRLSETEKEPWRRAAAAHFAPVLAGPRRLTDLCLLTQTAPDRPFVIAERLPLRG